MRISLRHDERAVSERFRDLGQACAIHRQVARRRVPQVVEAAMLVADKFRSSAHNTPRLI
jgi:hypothetical protein